MFAIVGRMERPRWSAALRWTVVGDEPGALFPDETAARRHVGTGEYRGLEFLEVNARSIINRVPAASRMPFRHTINVYRGCSHACSYCFARPTHEYLGLGIGEDFERTIVVKVNAVERLRAELRSPRWSGEPIAMGTNTDPYQKAEGKYHLTRGVIEVLGAHRSPFSILTKSTLILRDLHLLAEVARTTPVRLAFSIGTLDRRVWRLSEPGTPPPDKRVEALRRLVDAGITCGVLIAPVLPGLSDGDDQLRAVAAACVEAGAASVTAVPLHLRAGVRQHYLAWLEETLPDLVPLHRARFANGAYQPKEVTERITRVVAGVASPNGRSVARGRHRRVTVALPDGDEQPPAASPAPPSLPAPPVGRPAAADQLRLL